MNVLDFYSTDAPTPAQMAGLYEGEWTSTLPPVRGTVIPSGTVPLFEDGRIRWAIRQAGGLKGKRVVELGPLEGGHTFMLHKAKADRIVAVEANSLCFMRCLVVKELYRLQRAQFLFGDCLKFLRVAAKREARFDLCVASGILYHMMEPHELIEAMAEVSDSVYLWTQFYDHETISNRPDLIRRYSDPVELVGAHGTYQGFPHAYGAALDKTVEFIGGSAPSSVWMPLDEIKRAFTDAGLSEIEIHKVDLNHTNGPCVSLFAKRP